MKNQGEQMADLTLSGGCNCGAVRFELSEPPASAGYCHCRRCQRRSGAAASANAYVHLRTLRILSGEESMRAWKPETGREKWFCGECGSALFGGNPNSDDPIGVRLGAFDGDPGVRPSKRQFTDYAAPWEPIPDDGLPRYPERQPSYV
jgi:hypothetical protein